MNGYEGIDFQVIVALGILSLLTGPLVYAAFKVKEVRERRARRRNR